MALIGNLHTPRQDHACKVVEKKTRGPLVAKSIDSLAYRYLGQTPYPLRDANSEIPVLYKVEPTKILTFGKL